MNINSGERGRVLRAAGERMAGTDVPITNMEHTYLVTEPIREFLERDEEMVVWLGSRFAHWG